MRADSALSHLNDGELCIALMKSGEKHQVRWSKSDWSFYFIHTDRPSVCRFDDIKEWMPGSIRFHL